MKFTVECEMDESQAKAFASLLDYMQYCGTIGHSSNVLVFIDGDGAFRPKFKFDPSIPCDDLERIKNPYFKQTSGDDCDVFVERELDFV